MTIKTYGKKNN